METFVWWVDPAYLREEWKCATTTSGGQCVMTHGATLMPMWHVDSWDIVVQVRKYIIQTTASQNHAFCTGALAYSYSRFGRGTGGIFLDNMNCRGTESRLIDCRHSGIGVHNCDHTDDAGVRCSNGKSKLMLQPVVIIMNVYFSHKQLLL